MAVKLNQAASKYAKKLVDKNKVVRDDKDAWSEHQPSADEENKSSKSVVGLNTENGIWE